MNSSVQTYHKRLRDEVSLVEQEIESHLQQSERLKTRLEGLKRALELCDSEQYAVAELLRLGASGLELAAANPSKAPAVASKQPLPVRKAEPMRLTEILDRLGPAKETGVETQRSLRREWIRRYRRH